MLPDTVDVSVDGLKAKVQYLRKSLAGDEEVFDLARATLFLSQIDEAISNSGWVGSPTVTFDDLKTSKEEIKSFWRKSKLKFLQQTIERLPGYAKQGQRAQFAQASSRLWIALIGREFNSDELGMTLDQLIELAREARGGVAC